MLKIIAGFSLGIYIGTYYDLKPTIEYFFKLIKDIEKKNNNKK